MQSAPTTTVKAPAAAVNFIVGAPPEVGKLRVAAMEAMCAKGQPFKGKVMTPDVLDAVLDAARPDAAFAMRPRVCDDFPAGSVARKCVECRVLRAHPPRPPLTRREKVISSASFAGSSAVHLSVSPAFQEPLPSKS